MRQTVCTIDPSRILPFFFFARDRSTLCLAVSSFIGVGVVAQLLEKERETALNSVQPMHQLTIGVSRVSYFQIEDTSADRKGLPVDYFLCRLYSI